ncbi:hypothetical protein H271_01740 [Vibrio parahaemolyticus 1911C]|nr:hypothetical protein H271_01740 [Vibrio parahaemolyticus 1911C]
MHANKAQDSALFYIIGDIFCKKENKRHKLETLEKNQYIQLINELAKKLRLQGAMNT